MLSNHESICSHASINRPVTNLPPWDETLTPDTGTPYGSRTPTIDGLPCCATFQPTSQSVFDFKRTGYDVVKTCSHHQANDMAILNEETS